MSNNSGSRIKSGMTKKKSVYVGLSGGVDSSVAAALLQKEGYKVTGVFIKIWHPELSNCDWKAEMRDAMRVCAHLDIPFKMIDLSEEYFKEVIQYLIDEYKIGRTPNPDVMCNTIIKFGHFYDFAMRDGADFVATGHYASVEPGGSPRRRACRAEKRATPWLVRGVDQNKDQTYFLWNIKKEALENVLFPVGKYKKKEVRKLADKFGLPTANKKDSQGLCFIGDVDVKVFLKKHLDTQKGDVLDEAGEVIGQHDGAELYTFGERHGFSILNKKDNQKPHYVTKKDLDKNTVTVSENYSEEVEKVKELKLKNINLLVDTISPEKEIEVMTRYQGQLKKGVLKKDVFVFSEEQTPVASGQSVVFHDEEVCLGGGIVT